MLITPRPGVSLDNLIQSLGSVRTDASNRVSGVRPAHKRLLAYLEWASEAARMLGYQISEADLASLVLNRRYELLLSSFGTMASPEMEVQRVVNDLVTLELDERVKDLDAAIKTLDSYRKRWVSGIDLVVLDTGFYIKHPKKLKEADIAAAAGTPGSAVHVLVPMIVVDELDGLKQASKQHVRWRAGYSVAVLDQVFKNTTQDRPVGGLYREDNTTTPDGLVGRGQATMELLFDPSGHVRLPINDDEIVDRAVVVQRLAGRPVTLMTYDTGMSTRGRNAGLKVAKLSEDIGEEPE
jgi:PIN domain